MQLHAQAAAAFALSSLAPAANAAASTPAPPSAHVKASASDLLRLAIQFADRGLTQKADALLALLSHDPSGDIRNEARFRRAKLLQRQGMNTGAAVLLRQVLDDRPDATAARLELAQLLDRMGDKDAAWREVRAAQSARLPLSVARFIDRYAESLRAARPFGATIEIALAPDSNISRATRSDTLGTVIGDFHIDREGRARSGTGLALRGQAYRRLPIGDGDDTVLFRTTLLADLYRHSRFNDVALDMAAGPEFQLGTTRVALEVGATQRWFGQKPFVRSARVAVSAVRPVGRRSQLRVNASAALIDNQRNDLQDGKSYSVQLGFEHALAPDMGVALTLGRDRQSLADPAYSTTAWRMGGLAWRDIGRATVMAGIELGRLEADERLLLFPDKRSDRSSRFTIGTTLRQMSVAGFAPTMRLVIERNRSSVELYDYKRTRTEFGITRAF